VPPCSRSARARRARLRPRPRPRPRGPKRTWAPSTSSPRRGESSRSVRPALAMRTSHRPGHPRLPGRALGLSMTSSVKRVLKAPSDEQPTRNRPRRGAEVARTQQRHQAVDTPRHQIAVRRLAVGAPEPAAEVPGRHVRVPCERLDVQRPCVVPVDPIASAAQRASGRYCAESGRPVRRGRTSHKATVAQAAAHHCRANGGCHRQDRADVGARLRSTSR
jgi:hypothetical protein